MEIFNLTDAYHASGSLVRQWFTKSFVRSWPSLLLFVPLVLFPLLVHLCGEGSHALMDSAFYLMVATIFGSFYLGIGIASSSLHLIMWFPLITFGSSTRLILDSVHPYYICLMFFNLIFFSSGEPTTRCLSHPASLKTAPLDVEKYNFLEFPLNKRGRLVETIL